MWTLPGYGDYLERDDPDLRKRLAEFGGPAGFEDVVASISPIADDQPDVTAHWGVTFAVDDADAIAEQGHGARRQGDRPAVRCPVGSDDRSRRPPGGDLRRKQVRAREQGPREPAGLRRASRVGCRNGGSLPPGVVRSADRATVGVGKGWRWRPRHSWLGSAEATSRRTRTTRAGCGWRRHTRGRRACTEASTPTASRSGPARSGCCSSRTTSASSRRGRPRLSARSELRDRGAGRSHLALLHPHPCRSRDAGLLRPRRCGRGAGVRRGAAPAQRRGGGAGARVDARCASASRQRHVQHRSQSRPSPRGAHRDRAKPRGRRRPTRRRVARRRRRRRRDRRDRDVRIAPHLPRPRQRARQPRLRRCDA